MSKLKLDEIQQSIFDQAILSAFSGGWAKGASVFNGAKALSQDEVLKQIKETYCEE